METLKRQLTLPLLVLLMVACAGRLTISQQYLWALNVYERQWDMYFDQVIDPSIIPEDREMLRANPDKITEDMIRQTLTEDERKVLRQKRQVLQEVQPMLLAWDTYRKRGEVAPAELQNSITRMLDTLLSVGGG